MCDTDSVHEESEARDNTETDMMRLLTFAWINNNLVVHSRLKPFKASNMGQGHRSAAFVSLLLSLKKHDYNAPIQSAATLTEVESH